MRKLWPPPPPFPLTSPLFLSFSSPPIFLLCFILYFGKYTNIPRHLFIHFASDKVLSFKIGTLIFFTLSHRKDETNFMTWHFPLFSFSLPLSLFLFYYLIFPSSFSCFSLRLFLCLFLSVQPLSSSSSVVFFKFCVHHLLRVSVNAWFIKFFLSLITFLFLILTATAVQTVPQALHTSVFQFFFIFTFILLSTYRYIFHQHSWIDTAPYICTPNVRVSISRQDKNNFCGWFLRGHLTSRGQWL